MTTTPDYKFIDIHVHIMPWEMLNPSAAAAMEATQPDHAKLHNLSSNPDKRVFNLGADTLASQAIIRHELTQINTKKEKN